MAAKNLEGFEFLDDVSGIDSESAIQQVTFIAQTGDLGKEQGLSEEDVIVERLDQAGELKVEVGHGRSHQDVAVSVLYLHSGTHRRQPGCQANLNPLLCSPRNSCRSFRHSEIGIRMPIH